jgi:hypothetical protein
LVKRKPDPPCHGSVYISGRLARVLVSANFKTLDYPAINRSKSEKEHDASDINEYKVEQYFCGDDKFASIEN